VIPRLAGSARFGSGIVAGMRWFVAVLLVCLSASPALAQPPGDGAEEGVAEIPALRPAVTLGGLENRTIDRVEVSLEGARWTDPVQVKAVRQGDRLTAGAARRAARELLETGRFATVSVQAEEKGGLVVLRLVALPRRLIAGVRVDGGVLDEDAMRRDAHIAIGGEITATSLTQMTERLRLFHANRGFPEATVAIEVRGTDDPMRVVLAIRIEPGAPSKIASRIFVYDGARYPADPVLDDELKRLSEGYAVDPGSRIDGDALVAADRSLGERLKTSGYYRATVTHQLLVSRGRTFLYVRIASGPKFITRYEGLVHFDADQIDQALDIEHELDRSIHHLASKVVDFYVRRGFLDVEVDPEERGGQSDRVHVLHMTVREREQVKVASREFPCLTERPLSRSDLAREIDGILEEQLPGSGLSGLFGAVTSSTLDATIGPQGNTGARPSQRDLDPKRTYVADVYEAAQKHLQDFYRSQGFLFATVGPAQLVRRQCSRRSPPGGCTPMPVAVAAKNACLYDAAGLPMDEPAPDARLGCVPDPKQGIFCDPKLTVRIPIKLGPRSALYDIGFEGNKTFVEHDLARTADLELGSPVSQLEIDAARRRVLDAFKEEGFAFAEVRSVLDFSPDRTRARVRFVISEGERVVVDGIVVQGANRTDPSLIARRLTFETCLRGRPIDQCEPYRVSAVRKSEERIAALGTFSSVSISLEDPQVPARRKVVIVEVQESIPQYLDLRPGLSTGEGLRATFEYGHRNVGGKAIQLTLRTQVGYLPDAFILDQDVRENFDSLTLSQRLARRNTVSLMLPEVGLGPLIRLGLDGVDVRHNARDFGLTKDAGILTFTYQPVRTFYVQLGGSAERNDVGIFRGGTVDAYLQGLDPAARANLRRLLLVPDGLTYAVAERLSVTWDRRDSSLGATRGTLLIAAAEHVRAFPAPGEQDPWTSDFLRLTATASGYIRLSERGLALAMSVRGGRIYQLNQLITASPAHPEGSKTYPDRLFFLGGVNSLRGFLQDSLVPQDIADKIESGEIDDINKVAIRGGDVFINPRAELRIPLTGPLELGLFFDAGNVWVEPKNFDLLRLRYAAGPGLRIATPIGPVAFDYGFNLMQREWESRGNFHFSIGLF
jgi:outer membrane protein insertion porin family